MRALVTGGAGFIGSHVVDRLLADGADVVVLDDLSGGDLRNLDPRAELVKGDICDAGLLRAVVPGCDVVLHQAAHRSVIRSVEDPVATDRVNVAGTLALLVAARDAGVRRFVSASSSSVYGGVAPRPTPETAPLQPRSPYAVTKLAGEQYCRVFADLHGLETVSLRYFNVYGPRQRPDARYAAVIPLFIDALRRGGEPEVHGDGLQTRDFTFVSDVVEANLLALSSPADRCAGRAFNIAAGQAWSLLDVLAELSRGIGAGARPRHTDARAGDVRASRADTAAAARDLGFHASVGLDQGLARTVAWHLEEHDRG